jgi:aryl-alcohol dehydrogenase-like predicted oxidoreductase
MDTGDRRRWIDRREFLRCSALTGIGLGLLPLDARAAAEPPRVKRRVRLGRNGLQVSDIGFGSSRLQGEEDVVAHALERFFNDTATTEIYTGGSSEETLGRALRGKREQVLIASKVKARPGDSQETLMRALEGSLRRLRTDRIDVYFNHAVNNVARLQIPAWGEFVETAKRQGKIRFTGMSGHGGRLVQCLDQALDHDLVDVVLVGYNFGQDPAFYERLTESLDFVARQPDLPRVLARAKQKDVGVVAMKTLRGCLPLRAFHPRAHRLHPPAARRAGFVDPAARRCVRQGEAMHEVRLTSLVPAGG